MSKTSLEGQIAAALRIRQNFSLPETLTYLDLNDYSIDYRGAEVLANILRKNNTLLDLRISYSIGLDGAKYLLDALTENMTLTRLDITMPIHKVSSSYEWDDIITRIDDLLKKNKSLRQSIQRRVQEEVRKQREAEAKKQREEEEAKKKREAELNKKLLEDSKRNVEQLAKQRALEAKRLREAEEAKQRASLKAWIEGNNWEAVAAFIKEHSDFAITKFLSAGKYNLNTSTFINQLSAHTVQRTIEELDGAQTTLEAKYTELVSQCESLAQEEEELKKRLEQVGAKKKQLIDEGETLNKDLDAREVQITKAQENLKQIQASLAENTPKLNQWKERLRVDVVEWTNEDIEFLLRELDMANHAATFAKNKIDGSVLLDLTTSDLIDTLKLNFKEAKRLLKSIFLARIYKDIYTTPPGVLQWHVDTVCTWLEDNKFAHLTDIFRKQQITGSELAFIDRNDLKKYLGIEALGDCIKLEKVIKQLQQSHLAVSIQKQIAIELDEKTAGQNQRELDQKLHEMKTVNEELKLKLRNAKRDAPKAFCCPITQEIMNDPVVASDGHTYERVAIEAWLLHHDTSPMTNQRLENKSLTPSHTLKSMISEFVDRT